MKTLVTSNVFTNPESMNQAPYLSIYTWLNALFMVKKLVFRNQFFLFPDKDILSSQSFIYNVKVCLDIRPTADKKMHRQIEFKRFQGLLTQLSILLCFYSTALLSVWRFSATQFSTPTHVQVWECAEILLIFAHFCMRLHTNSRTLTWVGTKMCSRTHSLRIQMANILP